MASKADKRATVIAGTPKAQRRPKGDGLLTQRKDGLWEYRVDVGKDEDGKRKRRSIYAKSRAELKRRVEDEMARGGGTLRPRKAATVGEFATRWLSQVEASRSPNTHALYSGLWKKHASPRIGGLALDEVDAKKVGWLYAELKRAGCSASMVSNVGRTLHRMFEVARRQGEYHGENPFSMVDKPRHKARKMRALTVEEAQRLLEAARSDRLEALWVLLLTTGIRLGEGLGLQWDDVDFEARTLSIQRALVEIGSNRTANVVGSLELADTKTEQSNRLLNLGSLAVEALKRRREAWKSEGHGSPLIFSAAVGVGRGAVNGMRRSNLRRSHFLPLLKRAKLGEMRIHDLRHSSASLALLRGHSPKVVAERLGHSRVGITLDRYSHVLPGMGRVEADDMDRVLREPTPEGVSPK